MVIAGSLAICGHARAATTTLTFDPPAFATGEIVTQVGDVQFPDAPATFAVAGSGVARTASPPNALRRVETCFDRQCSSGAHRLRMSFARAMSSVALRVGAEQHPDCFPEGATCEAWARLTAHAADGTLVADSGDARVSDLVAGGPITTPIAVADPQARIRFATLVVGRETVSHDLEFFPRRPLIDNLSFTAPDAPTPASAPIDPRITGMDIVQAVQAGGVHQRSTGAWQPYIGSRLYSGTPTFVRVFANVPRAPGTASTRS
jgi:hypothetical protein